MKKIFCLMLALMLTPIFAVAEETTTPIPYFNQGDQSISAVAEETAEPVQLDITAEAEETAEEEAEEEEIVDRAEIYAPRTGKATLRKKASTKADVLRKCKAGVIVEVLERGEKFTKINYKGKEGYILTSCLMFHSSQEEPLEKCVLTLNGRATGKTTINIRNKADKESRKVAVWKTGTEVDVYGYSEDWVYIEADSIRGWVMEDYLTLPEEVEEAEEEA